jgi:hypothetical protein
MGIFVRSPETHDTEKVHWKKFTNRTQGNRAVGGRLYLTDRRLMLEPNRIDAAPKGRAWSAALFSIVEVRADTPNGNLFSGGVRTRLRLDLDDGHSGYFEVNGVQDVLEVIERAVRA